MDVEARLGHELARLLHAVSAVVLRCVRARVCLSGPTHTHTRTLHPLASLSHIYLTAPTCSYTALDPQTACVPQMGMDLLARNAELSCAVLLHALSRAPERSELRAHVEINLSVALAMSMRYAEAAAHVRALAGL